VNALKQKNIFIDYIVLNFNWFAITTRSQVLSPLLIPLLVQHYVGDAVKGTYLGIVRLIALMVALLVQALAGMLSDNNQSRWGRRRPYIVFGVVFEIGTLALLGLVAGMDGFTGYWVMLVIYIFSMVGSNVSHGATQGLIPDLVEDENKGLASGIKATLELPIPLIFVSFVVAPLFAQGKIWAGLIVLMVVLLAGMGVSLFIKEKPLESKPARMDWKPMLRLVSMSALFTLVILAIGAMVKTTISLTSAYESSQRMIILGIAGIIGIFIAVLLGVWLGVRASIGEEIKQHRSFTWWVINRLAFLVAAFNLSGFMVYFLQERFTEFAGERAAEPAARLLMFVGLAILITALPGGWLADKFGKKVLIMIAGLLVGFGTVFIVISPVFSWLYLGGVVIGAGVGLFYSANWALGTELVPQKRAGQFLGISNLAGAGAGAVGAYIGGPIADNVSYVLLMSIYGVIALLSIFALLGIKGVGAK
jgi:MFS family permease